ncbi:MAG TPA: hypothetical protein PK307_15155 [Spirochaetota bacterium]|nr:hypothetical protein [Spirochaetota bacterium]HOD15244.1 hypothetical protein [Spirochaetota bacterium]HPG49540.1 hypothetical protein [Spirochaetota bacterium]HPN12010.1 hypothetical protein [Spirochaetota bacterium]HQL83540.1 hypothetical protein [Spirochaetota bacterium]
MKLRIALLCIAGAAMALLFCGRTDYAAALTGTWQWTGDACDEDGSCKKEIITDEASGETFTRDGLHVTTRSRNGYSLDGTTIRFASTSNSCGTAEARIISLAGDMLLLECGSHIRRYARVMRR